MNEGARIEAAAKDGVILASKDLIERLDSADAETTGLDLDALAYTPLGESMVRATRRSGTPEPSPSPQSD